MLYLQPKRLIYPVLLSQIHFVWNEMKVSFSEVGCENTCHNRPSAAEKRIKNKIPNLDCKAINIGAESWNCTEISSDWLITQCMKHWMHAWISFLVIFCMPVQDFKTKEPLSKKTFSFFLFLLKSWENADRAFCIVTDDILYTCRKLSFLHYMWILFV